MTAAPTIKHKNSKIVTIFRKGSFIEDAQKESAAEFMSLSKKTIGGYFQTTVGSTYGCGLSYEEKRLLMPAIVAVGADDSTFLKKVETFFLEIAIPIPYEGGRAFEIGLTVDNNADLGFKAKTGEINMPINLGDYLKYRHCAGHPRVAGSREEGEGNQLYEYFIFDAEISRAANNKINAQKDAAMSIFLNVIKKESGKVSEMLTLLNIDPRQYSGKTEVIDREAALRVIAETDPTKFTEAYSLDHFETRYVVQTMINVGVLKKIGSQIVYAETGKVMGYNLEEAIYYIEDPKNVDEITILKGLMQEGLRKQVAKNTPAKSIR